MNNKIKLTAVVGIITVVLTVVIFMGTGHDNNQWTQVVKAVMVGVVAAVGVNVPLDINGKSDE